MSEATGEIEKDGTVLVVRRIHVVYRLRVPPEQRQTATRVHGMHRDACPVYRTISGCVDITTSLKVED